MFKDSDLAAVPASTNAQVDPPSLALDPRRLSEGELRPDKTSQAPLEDVQGRGDTRGIVLQRAGVTDVRYPATAIDPDGIERSTIVNLEMSVAVPADSKGTHMSRFIEIVQADERALSPESVIAMLREMQSRLEAQEARLAIEFPLFMEREAPVTKSKGMIDVGCAYVGMIDGEAIDLVQKVVVTVTSLCPCSKEISDYGAHNQRGALTVEVRTTKDADGIPVTLPLGELIYSAEESASCRIYPVLKRPDERWITMEAYENPVFVEDMVRGVATRLQADERVQSFRVHARNFESIHGHDAFAETSWSR